MPTTQLPPIDIDLSKAYNGHQFGPIEDLSTACKLCLHRVTVVELVHGVKLRCPSTITPTEVATGVVSTEDALARLNLAMNRVLGLLARSREELQALKSKVTAEEYTIRLLEEKQRTIQHHLDLRKPRPGALPMPEGGASYAAAMEKSAFSNAHEHNPLTNLSALVDSMVAKGQEIREQQEKLAAYDYEAGGETEEEQLSAAYAYAHLVLGEQGNVYERDDVVRMLRDGSFKRFVEEGKKLRPATNVFVEPTCSHMNTSTHTAGDAFIECNVCHAFKMLRDGPEAPWQTTRSRS